MDLSDDIFAQIEKSDASLLLEYLKDKQIRKSYKNIPEKIDLKDIRKQIGLIKKDSWGICLNDKLIGIRNVIIHKEYAETGSWIAKGYRNKGYGTAALKLFLNNISTRNIIRSKPISKSSKSVLTKNGFVEQGNYFVFSKPNNII